MEVRKGADNQHPGRNQFAQRVGGGIDGHADGFTRRHRPAGQIGGKLQSPAVMPGPHRGRQLRRLRRHRAQAEPGCFPQKDANQASAQENPEPVGHGLDHRRRLRRGAQSLRHFDQNLGAPALLAGDLGKAAGFQQTAQLSRQDRGLGRQVLVEKIRIGAMQKRRRPDGFVAHYQRRRHDRAGPILRRHYIARWVQPVLQDRLALLKSFDGDRALTGSEPGPRKAIRHHPIGLGAHQLVPADTRCQK